MARIPVNKTYKLFIGGKFPRTESGRFYELVDRRDRLLANVPLASAGDLHGAVLVARQVQEQWGDATPYLRGRILYRLAEMLEGRAEQFVEELRVQGSTPARARKEVAAAVDLLVHYAGWSDKFQALFSSVNPVASPHHSISVPEPTGVVAIVAPEMSGLLGLCSVLAPVLVGGNSAVVLASQSMPLSALTLAEVIHSADVPGGVVNILTGELDELLPDLSSHMDLNAILLCSDEPGDRALVESQAAESVTRVRVQPDAPLAESPYHILDFQEIKTTWHPVGG